MKTLKLWSHAMNDDNISPCPGGVIIEMRGYNRFEDFYLCVPEQGIYTRSANSSRYGEWKFEYFIDGEFVGAGRMDRKIKAEQLYNAGYKEESRLYILGYMFWRETPLGGKKINKYKEAARISHELCDLPGKYGHEVRQRIRRKILLGVGIY